MYLYVYCVYGFIVKRYTSIRLGNLPNKVMNIPGKKYSIVVASFRYRLSPSFTYRFPYRFP